MSVAIGPCTLSEIRRSVSHCVLMGIPVKVICLLVVLTKTIWEDGDGINSFAERRRDLDLMV